MPAAVQTYLDTNNIQRVVAIQQSILQMYRKDISQYDPESKLYIEDIFDLIPAELNAQNKRFILKNLNNEEGINFGSVYENAVAQELKAHGFKLYYFNSKKQGELDFKFYLPQILRRIGNYSPQERGFNQSLQLTKAPIILPKSPAFS